jgi:hypothetical protein
MPDQPMELGVAESIIGEMPEERWEAFLAGDAEPTLEEIRAFRSLWDAYRQRSSVGNVRSVFRRSPERFPR